VNTNNQTVELEKKSEQKNLLYKFGNWNFLKRIFSSSDLSISDWERIESKPKRPNCNERFF
jgi:hypothetical protein